MKLLTSMNLLHKAAKGLLLLPLLGMFAFAATSARADEYHHHHHHRHHHHYHHDTGAVPMNGRNDSGTGTRS